MFITSFTTMCAFIATATSPLVGSQSFGIYTAFCVWTDYVFVMTWFPSCLIIYHNYYEKRPFCKCCRKPIPVDQTSTAMAKVNDSIKLKKPWHLIPEKILHYRFIFIGVFLLSLIPLALATAKLKAATKIQQDLPEDHPVQAIFNI